MTTRRPQAAKLIAGTARADRKPKPEIAARLLVPPPPPAHLSKHAKEEWRRLAPSAVGLGTLTTADVHAFALLAETFATIREATETLSTMGLSSATADGGLKPHPAVRIMETARAQARGLLSDFGLTPRGRQGVDVLPPPKAGTGTSSEINPWVRFKKLQTGGQ